MVILQQDATIEEIRTTLINTIQDYNSRSLCGDTLNLGIPSDLSQMSLEQLKNFAIQEEWLEFE